MMNPRPELPRDEPTYPVLIERDADGWPIRATVMPGDGFYELFEPLKDAN